MLRRVAIPVILLGTFLASAPAGLARAEDGADPARAAVAPARVERVGDAEVLIDIVYAELAGGRKLHLDLYRPAEGDGAGAGAAKRRPAILWIHGGSWAAGSKASGRQRLTQILVEKGYAVAAVEYRLIGEAIFPAQIHDVKRAVRFLRRNADALGIDGERLAAWGISAGGHLACLLATTDADDGLEPPDDGLAPVSTRIQAAASWVGPMNLRIVEAAPQRALGRSILRNFLGKEPEEDPAVYVLASPVTHVTTDDPPLFLVQGLDDPLVPPVQASEMQAAADRAGVRNVTILVEHMGHGNQTPLAPPMAPSVDEVRAAFVGFLDTFVRRAPVLR